MGGDHLLFTALEVCSGAPSTLALTQTYCWCKSHSSHTPLLPSCHEYLNKYTYIHCRTLSGILLLAWSYAWITPLSEGVQLWRVSFVFSVYPDSLWWHIRWENIQKEYLLRLPGTQKWRGVSTIMHLCSQTDDTPPDLSVHLPPQSRFTALFSAALFARGALFSSALNELNGRAAKRSARSTRQI